MMWKEFEELAGYEVTYEDYTKIIEPMYMAIPESISKREFVKMIDRKRFDYKAKEKAEKKAMVKAMKEIAEERAANCEHFCDYEAEEKLMEIARSYMDKYFPKNRGYHGDIERKHWANLSTGCTYPAEFVIYREIHGEWYEEQRITLAQWKAA